MGSSRSTTTWLLSERPTTSNEPRCRLAAAVPSADINKELEFQLGRARFVKLHGSIDWAFTGDGNVINNVTAEQALRAEIAISEKRAADAPVWKALG
jgi:hypothetical protein